MGAAPAPPRALPEAGLAGNRTVVVGRCVWFGCKGFGERQPHIQWLKHIEVNGSKGGTDGLPYVRVLKVKTSTFFFF